MLAKGIFSLLRKVDWVLLGSVLFLILLGLEAIYSLSLGETGLTRFDKQLIAAGFGLILLLAVALIDHHRLGSLSWLLYGVSAVLLVLVLIFGTTFGGTTGWFVFGQFSFQPIELVKVFAIIILAYYLATRSGVSGTRLWLESLALLVPFIILLALQPDLAPIILLLVIWFIMNAGRGLKARGWLAVVGITLIVAVTAWLVVLNDTQKARLTTFINPAADIEGSGFQIRQSIIAVGSGGLTGRGLGEGFQSQLEFLPAAATDFIFASILEERGLAGFILVIAIFLIMFWRLWRLLRRSSGAYTQYLVLGLSLLLVIQILLNMAMNLGLAPVIGLPLPFLTAGASALTASMLVIGILTSVAIRQKV